MAQILIVDDEPSVANAIRRMVQRLGHEVESTTSSVDALRRVSDRRPDVVITDIQMPTMDGLELAREMERRFERECPAFVFMSGCSSPEEGASSLRRWRFLAKPFHWSDLAGSIAELLRLGA